jgi:4-hydroxyphenylacetate decarboxylase small subunit
VTVSAHPESRHSACRNYAPLDVVKGICHRTKEIILGDDDGCEHLDLMPRCRHCASFIPATEPHLGVCAAGEGRPSTYPDLVGLNCEHFSWREERTFERSDV